MVYIITFYFIFNLTAFNDQSIFFLSKLLRTFLKNTIDYFKILSLFRFEMNSLNINNFILFYLISLNKIYTLKSPAELSMEVGNTYYFDYIQFSSIFVSLGT